MQGSGGMTGIQKESDGCDDLAKFVEILKAWGVRNDFESETE